MKNAYTVARNKLHNFLKNKLTTTGKEYDLGKGYLEWVGGKSEIILNEKSFAIPPDIYVHKGVTMIREAPTDPNLRVLQRGSVVWCHFGFNIDHEFGGKHPALVLFVGGGNCAVVVPLSSQEPTEDQKKSGIYFEVPRVYGMKPIKRWGNVLETRQVSMQRFELGVIGSVKGSVLDEVSKAMKATKIWRF